MSYSANDNQNYFVQAGRSTSRVLSQPGGKSSFSLGGWTPEELERQRLKREGKALKKPEQRKLGDLITYVWCFRIVSHESNHV